MERQSPRCGCNCGCGRNSRSGNMGTPAQRSPESTDCTHVHVPLTAIVYIAMQEFQNIYEPVAGFGRGTIFADLDKPLLTGGMCRGK